tara:strand:- start:15 stop:704 length:690 start_codon:yes stop_codon:yes gene_type:complete
MSKTTIPTGGLVDNSVTTDKVQIANTNTTAGNVRINDKSGDQSAGNPQYTFSNNTGTGMRRAASNIVAFDTNSNEAMRIDAAGHVTKPLQPGFLASSGTQNNMAVGAYVDIIYSTEIFDNNADYNTGNYTFTAPVTGRYHFSFSLNLSGVDTAGMNYVWFILDTSNRDYRLDIIHSNLGEADLALHGFKGTVIADMDAADTAKIRFYQDGGTAQADVDDNSYFSGYLLG